MRADANQSSFIAKDAELAMRSLELRSQGIAAQKEQDQFNRQMRNVSHAINATGLAFRIGEMVSENEGRKFMAENQGARDYINEQIIQAAKNNHEQWEPVFEADGTPKMTTINGVEQQEKRFVGYDNYQTPDGRTIGQLEEELSSKINKVGILFWTKDKVKSQFLNSKFNAEAKAQAIMYERERNIAMEFESSGAIDNDNKFITDSLYNSSNELVKDEAGLRDFYREYHRGFSHNSNSMVELKTQQSVERAINGKIQYNATGLATNQQYAEARETVAKASEAGLINADTKENTLENITKIQRQANLDTWGEARNQVLGAGNPWDRLKEARKQEVRFREGGELDANYSDQQDAQASHHQWFINEIEQLERETKARAERGSKDKEENLMEYAWDYLSMLESGKDAKGNPYTHKDAERDLEALHAAGLSSRNVRSMREKFYGFLPPPVQDVMPKIDAALKPLEDNPETYQRAKEIRAMFNERVWGGYTRDERSANEAAEKVIQLANAKTAGNAKGNKTQNTGLYEGTDFKTTSPTGWESNINIDREAKNDLRTRNQSILETNTKNTTWQVGEGNRTDGTFTLTDNVTKERLTARVGNNGKPEVMVNGSWQSFNEHKEKGIVRRMEEIYNKEISDEQRQQIDKLRTQGARTDRANPTVQGAFEAELRKIMGGAVIQREWWEEFKSREWEKYRKRMSNPNPKRNTGNRR